MVTEPLGIIELLTRIGEDHIRVQNLVDSATNFQERGKRGDRHTAITFLTNAMNTTEVFHGKPRYVGLVLWLPSERVEQVRRGHADQMTACGPSQPDEKMPRIETP